ncbi:MAG: GLUG motif-containing protein, partial [Anaerolineales bacterium]
MLSRFRGYVTAVVLFLTIVPATQAKYGGGTGEPNNPYLIYTAEHLNAIGVESNDWGKHFKLVADIDLSEFSYSTALIVPDTANNTAGFQGTPFTGIFDGNDHIISNLTIDGAGYLGLFGCLAPEGEIKDLELVDVNIVGSGDCVGGLVGQNGGILSQCRSTGGVSGDTEVGGLAGHNFGLVANCHSAGAISGIGKVGGLVGYNLSGQVLQCYSTGTVRASGWYVGGLLGSNSGYVLRCYSTGAVRGRYYAGGLVAINSGSIINCYSTGLISGIGPAFGGLVGSNTGIVIDCFWDTQATGLNRSEAGTGLTTIQMQDIQTYLDAGWDWAGQANDGISEVWQMPEEGGYPVLAVFSGYAPAELQGLGTAEDPYLVSEALELAAMVNY